MRLYCVPLAKMVDFVAIKTRYSGLFCRVPIIGERSPRVGGLGLNALPDCAESPSRDIIYNTADGDHGRDATHCFSTSGDNAGK